MALIFDGRTRAAWSLNAGSGWPSDGGWTQLASGLCPYFPNTPTLQGTLYDGMRANFDPSSNERCDLQEPGSSSTPTSPLGGTRCWIWAERIITKGSAISGRWMYLGPEIHTSSSSGQSQIAMCVRNNWERHLERNPPDIANFSSIQFHPAWGQTGWAMPTNEWVVYRMYFKLAGDSSGFCQLWRNGVQLVNFSGPTATAGRGGYLKMAMYRNAGQTGKVVYQVCGFQVFDSLVADPYTGQQNPPPDPEPDPDPPAQITVSATAPVQDQTYTGAVPYDITLQNPPASYYLYVGLAPSGVSVTRRAADESASNRHAGSLLIPEAAASQQYFYAALHNGSNVKVADQVFTINTVYAATPTVTVRPDGAEVQAGGVTQQFTADVTGTRTWQVNGITGGNSTVGTINSNGLYTSPASVPNPATVTVGVNIVGTYYTASDTATLTITAAPPVDPPPPPPPDAGEELPPDPPPVDEPDPELPPVIVIMPGRRTINPYLRFRFRSLGFRARRRRR